HAIGRYGPREKWTGWDLNPKCPRDGSACLLLVKKEVQDFPSAQDWDCADSFHVQEVLVAGDKSVDPRNKRRGSERCIFRISYSVSPGVDLRAVFPPAEQLPRCSPAAGRTHSLAPRQISVLPFRRPSFFRIEAGTVTCPLDVTVATSSMHEW